MYTFSAYNFKRLRDYCENLDISAIILKKHNVMIIGLFKIIKSGIMLS